MSGLLGVYWLNFSEESLFLRAGSKTALSLIYFNFNNSLSYVDQLNQVLHYLGTPSEDTLRRVGSPRVRPSSFAVVAFLTLI
jgi:hypothetical protein